MLPSQQVDLSRSGGPGHRQAPRARPHGAAPRSGIGSTRAGESAARSLQHRRGAWPGGRRPSPAPAARAAAVSRVRTPSSPPACASRGRAERADHVGPAPRVRGVAARRGAPRHTSGRPWERARAAPSARGSCGAAVSARSRLEPGSIGPRQVPAAPHGRVARRTLLGRWREGVRAPEGRSPRRGRPFADHVRGGPLEATPPAPSSAPPAPEARHTPRRAVDDAGNVPWCTGQVGGRPGVGGGSGGGGRPRADKPPGQRHAGARWRTFGLGIGSVALGGAVVPVSRGFRAFAAGSGGWPSAARERERSPVGRSAV